LISASRKGSGIHSFGHSYSGGQMVSLFQEAVGLLMCSYYTIFRMHMATLALE